MQMSFPQAFAAAGASGSSLDSGAAAILVIIRVVWWALYVVQGFMAYGTAYRKTKANGDNGVSLYGWMIVYTLAALVPGLGIYLWSKSKEQSNPPAQSTEEPLSPVAPPTDRPTF